MVVELRRMKLPFIFLLIGALALQNIDNVGGLQFFGDILENLETLGEQIRTEFIDELKNISQSTSEAASELESNLKNQAAAAIKNLQEIGESARENARQITMSNVDAFQAIIKAFVQTLEDEINNQRNSIRRSALQAAQSSLENISKSSSSLSRIGNDLSKTVSNGVIKGEQRIQGIWSYYINTQLRKVARASSNNETQINQADNFLRNILRTYDDDLEKCASSIESRVSEFTDKVDESIQVGQQILQELLEVIQACLDADDTSESDAECRENIEDKLTELSVIPDEISSLAAEGASLLLVRFESSTCVVQTLVKFELEKIHVSLTIKEIIDGTYDETDIADDDVNGSTVSIEDSTTNIASQNESDSDSN